MGGIHDAGLPRSSTVRVVNGVGKAVGTSRGIGTGGRRGEENDTAATTAARAMPFAGKPRRLNGPSFPTVAAGSGDGEAAEAAAVGKNEDRTTCATSPGAVIQSAKGRLTVGSNCSGASDGSGVHDNDSTARAAAAIDARACSAAGGAGGGARGYRCKRYRCW